MGMKYIQNGILRKKKNGGYEAVKLMKYIQNGILSNNYATSSYRFAHEIYTEWNFEPEDKEDQILGRQMKYIQNGILSLF